VKLASFRAGGKDRIGISFDGAILVEISGPGSILELIETGSEVVASANKYPLNDVVWYPPVRRPSKICCLALNNSANSDRILQGPKHPAMFIKPASSLIGHGGAIECKPHYGRVHPEPELAVVIGKTAKNIAARDAYEYVFGYTIHNDITSPTMRAEDTFHYRAIHPKAGDPKAIEYVDTWVSYPGRYKCCDTFACMGPWLVTKDEIADPHNLAVRTTPKICSTRSRKCWRSYPAT
jgi:2-keto-4-pentenoate hydratase/2-oxohepta-3-ene-1,7-dioic acid hydratase in catechol pathway